MSAGFVTRVSREGKHEESRHHYRRSSSGVIKLAGEMGARDLFTVVCVLVIRAWPSHSKRSGATASGSVHGKTHKGPALEAQCVHKDKYRRLVKKKHARNPFWRTAKWDIRCRSGEGMSYGMGPCAK